jgi:chromosomal replication initiation ATPase DnaA
MSVVEILPPDEAMLTGRLRAAAARHYLKLEPEVISYLAPRLDLTYEAIEAFAEKLSHGVTNDRTRTFCSSGKRGIGGDGAGGP